MKMYKEKSGNENSIISKQLEDLIIELDEEDRRVLPKWRVKCVESLNYKVKDLLLDYHAKRLKYNS